MIVGNGWITKLVVRNITRPVIPLSTTPTRHLANRTSIVPSKSYTTLANSLYKCSNMGQLKNYYYSCLNHPIKSTLTKAIDKGNRKEMVGSNITMDTSSHLYLHIIRNEPHGS